MTDGRCFHSGMVIASMLLCLLFFSGVSRSEEQNNKGKKEPTVITSRTLTADNKARTALFEGSVAARKGEMTLFADKMLVFYSEEETAGSSIRKIEAEGSVKVIKGDRVITSRNATYLTEPEERIIFTGEPRASEGENVVTGTKMTYFMKDDRSLVENSKVFIVEKGSKTGVGGKR